MRTSVSFEKRSCIIIGRRICGHKIFLESGLRRRGTLGDKDQFQVIDDPVHHGRLGEERDDLHRASTAGTAQGVDLIDLADHLGPALGGDAAGLLLDNPQRERRSPCLPDLPPMGVGVQAVIADSHKIE